MIRSVLCGLRFSRRAEGLASCRNSHPQLQIEPLMNFGSPAVENRISKSVVASTWSRIRTSQFWIVTIALCLRLAWILISHTYKFKAADNNFGFGWEMGRIGASLASGHGFSSPFGPPTGPTAWEPPLYPCLTAGVFLVFGIYSKASAFVLLALNSLFSALTCVPIFLIARRIFFEKVQRFFPNHNLVLVSDSLGLPQQFKPVGFGRLGEGP